MNIELVRKIRMLIFHLYSLDGKKMYVFHLNRFSSQQSRVSLNVRCHVLLIHVASNFHMIQRIFINKSTYSSSFGSSYAHNGSIKQLWKEKKPNPRQWIILYKCIVYKTHNNGTSSEEWIEKWLHSFNCTECACFIICCIKNQFHLNSRCIRFTFAHSLANICSI